MRPDFLSDYYYPGDAYVDVMGHNLYDDDWSLSSDLDLVYRAYPKVYAFPQAGPDLIIDGTFDERITIDGLRARFPRASYFSAWNTFLSTHFALIDNLYTQELLDDPWIATLEDMP